MSLLSSSLRMGEKQGERALSCSERLLSLDHGLDTVVHVLDKLALGAAESALVRDIEGAIIGLGVLAVDASDLDVELVSDFLELVHLLGELRELDVDGGAEGGSEVGRARGDIAEVRVVGELGNLLDGGGSAGKAVEDGMEIGAGLHGDDSELILLIDPHEESLGVVVEDASAFGPLAVETASL